MWGWESLMIRINLYITKNWKGITQREGNKPSLYDVLFYGAAYLFKAACIRLSASTSSGRGQPKFSRAKRANP